MQFATSDRCARRWPHVVQHGAELHCARLMARPSRPCRAVKTCQASSSTGASSSLVLAEPNLTRRMFELVDQRAAKSAQAGGAGGRTTLEAFLATDQAWYNLRHMQTGAAAGPAPEFVKNHPGRRIADNPHVAATSHTSTTSSTTVKSSSSSTSASASGGSKGPCTYDVIVAGGTLGIFEAVALAQRGWHVAVVERGKLQGRTQEWNISRKELEELVELGLLTPGEAEGVVALEFNPVRVGFHGGADVWTRDVLNLGVKPDKLINLMRSKLEASGGKVLENINLSAVDVYSDGAALTISSQTVPGGASPTEAAAGAGGGAGAAGLSQGARVQYSTTLTTRLLLDCMGHASPIVRQLRWGQKPDGVCLVVGGCARGFDPASNTTADIIYTNGDMTPPGAAAAAAAAGGDVDSKAAASRNKQLQYFWEAFPAADGLLGPSPHAISRTAGDWRSDARTTYMFTYMDAQPWRPSLEQLFEDYWRLMPQYQQLQGGLQQLDFLRLLFGFFPTFRNSPLQPGFDRVLQIGDASGIQSPLSFGGFGALTRHLKRLSSALDDALTSDALSQQDLGLINAYNPGLSSAWMLQRAMTGSRSPGDPGPNPDLINKMLAANFHAMVDLGDDVLKPFLQDVIQFGPLMKTMAAQVVQDPLFVPQLMAHVGPAALADWMVHVGGLGAFSALNSTASAPLKALANSQVLPQKTQYLLRRTLDAWQYGSGSDYRP